MNINCPDYINTAFRLLEQSGFKAYAVGGCVRDSLMGKTPDDWDMTTSSTPEQTIEVFKDFRVIPTGLKHGTVTVIIDGRHIEITTMRIDGEYHDTRRPESVCFTTEIEQDLSRRDFTVNAMAMDACGNLIDQHINLQIRWAYALHRRYHSAQDVVETFVLVGILDRHQVTYLLHDADCRAVTLGVIAYRTAVGVRKVVA